MQRRCWHMSHLTDNTGDIRIHCLQAHTSEYLLGNYYGNPAGSVITPFTAIKVCGVVAATQMCKSALRWSHSMKQVCKLVADPCLDAHRTRWMAGGARIW